MDLQSVLKTYKDFPKQGITVILSSHILSEVVQIADYIGIIASGKLEYENHIDKNEDLEKIFMRVVINKDRGND